MCQEGELCFSQVRESARGQSQARKENWAKARDKDRNWGSQDKPRGAREPRTGVESGGPAHGWCSWGQNIPCGCSHTGIGQGRSGHRSPGVGMGSNSKDSLQGRSRDQRPLKYDLSTPILSPMGKYGARHMDSSYISVLTHLVALSGLWCSPKSPICSHSYGWKLPALPCSGPALVSSLVHTGPPREVSPLPCCHRSTAGRESRHQTVTPKIRKQLTRRNNHTLLEHSLLAQSESSTKGWVCEVQKRNKGGGFSLTSPQTLCTWTLGR